MFCSGDSVRTAPPVSAMMKEMTPHRDAGTGGGGGGGSSGAASSAAADGATGPTAHAPTGTLIAHDSGTPLSTELTGETGDGTHLSAARPATEAGRPERELRRCTPTRRRPVALSTPTQGRPGDEQTQHACGRLPEIAAAGVTERLTERGQRSAGEAADLSCFADIDTGPAVVRQSDTGIDASPSVSGTSPAAAVSPSVSNTGPASSFVSVSIRRRSSCVSVSL